MRLENLSLVTKDGSHAKFQFRFDENVYDLDAEYSNDKHEWKICTILFHQTGKRDILLETFVQEIQQALNRVYKEPA